MLIKCTTCGERISMKWLTLGMPWSKYTCAQCRSVYAGTLLRLIMVSLCTGVLGYVLIGVVKGKIDFWFLPLPLALTLAVLYLDLPKQIKKVGVPAQADESEGV
jgi:hypothetical protein